MIISLDIETYGAFERFDQGGRTCPDQTVFNPRLSAKVDDVPIPTRMVPQCAITLVHGDPENPTGWEPGPTAIYDTTKDLDRLVATIRAATTIVGSNITFDIMYLLQFPEIREALETNLMGRPVLVDTIILSWIHSGVRKERSLKALGPALGAFAYDRTLKEGKFKFPMCADAVKYNAEDTHNAVLAAKALAQRTWDENHVEVNGKVLRFHSDRLWNIVDMSLVGQRFDTDELQAHQDYHMEESEWAEQQLAESGILLSGEGSATTQAELIDRCVTHAGEHFTDLHDSGLLEYSDKKRAVRNNRENRNILIAILNDGNQPCPDVRLLTLMNRHAEHTASEHEYRKIIADRIQRGGDTPPVNSGCIASCDQRHCYPSWYGAPTEDGGARSMRLSCRRPAAQTWTKELRKLMKPMPQHTVWHMDMSAFELRIAALLSNDKDAIEFASRPLPYNYLGGRNRDAAKVALLVGINGGTPDKAWRTAIATTGTLISKAEVRALPVWQWPKFREWQQETFRLGHGNELLLPGTGIKYQHNPTRTIHDTVSFMIQGTAAVFMSKVQHQIQARGNKVCLQLHDELVIQTTKTDKNLGLDIDASLNNVAYSMFLKNPFAYTMRCEYPDPYEAGVHAAD